MIQKDDLIKLTGMARIKLTEEELSEMKGDFESILGYVSEIQEVIGSDEEKEMGTHYNVMREDGVPHESGIHTDIIVAQFPQTEGNHLKVKKILQND